MLRTNLGTVHNSVTTIKLKRIIQLRQPLLRKVIPGILNPTIRLHQHSRTQVLIRVPPVRRTRGATTRAEDAFVHAVELGAIFARLEEFGLAFLLPFFGLQPRFDGAVLLVEVAHVRYQVLEHVHVREGVDFRGLAARVGRPLGLDVAQAGEGVRSVDVHRARAADALATGAAKGEGGVLLVFDFDERVEDHGTALV
mmetsp:Transcript_24228/g.32267  ORF Transcript_24228/g.32267 Transcript_24228/m.32267 type:complete len:197 (-) Transcript_24228:449-1039(-)